MSDNRKFIVKNKPLPKAQDLEALKAEGIRLAKQYSGDIWTDYNDHDPGVTILENLCYAITEMSYKVNFDFEQLFFAGDSPDNEIRLEDFFLLKQQEVFYSNPVTILDYRKLFLDHLGGEGILRNIWFVGDEGPGEGYSIFAYLEDDEEKASHLKKLAAVYHAHRNFGENCKEIICLQSVSVHDQITINEAYRDSLSNKVLVESIAQFIYDIKNYIEPPVRFAKSMQAFKLSEEELGPLLNGPRPVKKFIHPADLAATSLNRLQEDVELQTFINRHAGKWNNLIQFNGERTLKRVNTQDRTIAVFDEEAFIANHFGELESEKIREAYRRKSVKPLLNGTVEWETYQPHSNINKTDLGEYYSIQYTFPQNYSLGLDDLTGLPEESRKQLQNLQSYLLLFESLLVDFLVKIISFPALLKFDGNGGSNHIEGEFLKMLGFIPGTGLPGKNGKSEGANGRPEAKNHTGSLAEKEEVLKGIYNKYGFGRSQQIKLREYALARYGESFDTERINLAWGEPDNFEEDWLKCLNALILEYTTYSPARQTSFNVQMENSDFPLSRKISTLLNKAYGQNEPNIYIIEKQLLETEGTGLFKVAVVIDLKEQGDISDKRKEAIQKIVREELPFHLDIINFFFLKDLPEEQEDISLIELFGEGHTDNSETLARKGFLEAYKDWRKSLASAQDNHNEET